MCEILCMSTLSRQKIKGNNDLNAMYVDTVETKRKYTKLDYIYVYLFIMSTLLICLQNILDLMGLMSIQLIRLNYNVSPNTKYSNYIEHRIKCSNYKRIRFIPSNYNKLQINTSN